MLYCYILNYNQYQALHLCEFSKNTWIRIKELIITILKNKTIVEKINGRNKAVQIDETAIFNSKIISSTSFSLDDIPGIQWLIGGIDNSPEKKYFWN